MTASTMRLVRADGSSAQAPYVPPKPPLPHATLRQVWNAHVLPRLKRERCSPHTITDYRTLLKKWETHTPDLPLYAVDDPAAQEFADTLLAWHHNQDEDGYGAVQKNIRYLKVICRAAVKQELMARIPDVIVAVPEPDPDDESGRRRIEAAEISAAYSACDVAAWPGGGLAPAIWRLLFVLGYTFGPRREDLLGLKWENVRFSQACPHPKYRKKITAPHGWLVYLPSKTRKRKPQNLYLPLTEQAAEHLRRHHVRGASGPIFGFPKNDRDLHETRRKIWRATGMSDRPYDFRELRFTCSCEWNDLRVDLGDHVTGHAPRGVNARHYDQALRRLVRFVRRFPQPEAFKPTKPDPQLKLF